MVSSSKIEPTPRIQDGVQDGRRHGEILNFADIIESGVDSYVK